MARSCFRVLAFVMLGVVCTIATSSVLHCTHLLRARAALSRPVSANGSPTYINLPTLWATDEAAARSVGIQALESADPVEARAVLKRMRSLAVSSGVVSGVALIDPDRAWRRHRRVQRGMVQMPSTPFPIPFGQCTEDRLGWRSGESQAVVFGRDSAGFYRSTGEMLVVFQVGWP